MTHLFLLRRQRLELFEKRVGVQVIGETALSGSELRWKVFCFFLYLVKALGSRRPGGGGRTGLGCGLLPGGSLLGRHIVGYGRGEDETKGGSECEYYMDLFIFYVYGTEKRLCMSGAKTVARFKFSVYTNFRRNAS